MPEGKKTADMQNSIRVLAFSFCIKEVANVALANGQYCFTPLPNEQKNNRPVRLISSGRSYFKHSIPRGLKSIDILSPCLVACFCPENYSPVLLQVFR